VKLDDHAERLGAGPKPEGKEEAPPAPGPSDSGEGLWIFNDPQERARRLEDFYDVPDKEVGRGASSIRV
jgi:hypothetical protein